VSLTLWIGTDEANKYHILGPITDRVFHGGFSFRGHLLPPLETHYVREPSKLPMVLLTILISWLSRYNLHFKATSVSHSSTLSLKLSRPMNVCGKVLASQKTMSGAWTGRERDLAIRDNKGCTTVHSDDYLLVHADPTKKIPSYEKFPCCDRSRGLYLILCGCVVNTFERF
jgi:hypothetical protein